jgi:glyoxylase I family protein
MPATSGVSHLAFTVTDMEASAAWYKRVFGWTVLCRFTAGEAGSPRILLIDPASFFVVGLCQPADGAPGEFDHRVIGLDHFALSVPNEQELHAWAAHLDAEGVAVSPVREVPALGRFVSFEDPDGIQLELWLTATA